LTHGNRAFNTLRAQYAGVHAARVSYNIQRHVCDPWNIASTLDTVAPLSAQFFRDTEVAARTVNKETAVTERVQFIYSQAAAFRAKCIVPAGATALRAQAGIS
jgi:hypothetical protein